MPDVTEHQHLLLLTALQLAVPHEIDVLRGEDPDALAEIARAAVPAIAEHGDQLLYGGPECGRAMAALTRALAAAALTAWGGITVAGAHWCAVRGCPDADADHPQPEGWTPTPDPGHPRSIVKVLTVGGLL